MILQVYSSDNDSSDNDSSESVSIDSYGSERYNSENDRSDNDSSDIDIDIESSDSIESNNSDSDIRDTDSNDSESNNSGSNYSVNSISDSIDIRSSYSDTFEHHLTHAQTFLTYGYTLFTLSWHFLVISDASRQPFPNTFLSLHRTAQQKENRIYTDTVASIMTIPFCKLWKLWNLNTEVIHVQAYILLYKNNNIKTLAPCTEVITGLINQYIEVGANTLKSCFTYLKPCFLE